MNLLKTILVLVAICLLVSPALATTYYVDSVGGSDGNAGTSSGAAWQSLAKVNGITFSGGDQILFKTDCLWLGQLNPKGSGSAGNTIKIDVYGTGARPIIDGDEAVGNGVLYFYNQEYWDVNGLELTDDAATGADRRGVYLSAENYGTVDHIYLTNLYIHHIKGLVGQESSHKRTGGIIIETINDNSVDTRFNDILIEGCTIETADNQGIATTHAVTVGDYPGTVDWERRKVTNLRIRNNMIHDISKNAMIIRLTDESCVVEYNVCYDTAFRTGTGNTIFSRSSRGTVFQYNEGYLNKTTDYDGCLYDADLQSPQCIFQYSYSHDNNHGLFWQCTVAADDNVIVRYNISQNDKGSIFCMNYANTSTYVYNNTIYIPSHLSPRIVDERKNAVKTYYFYNNIIYNDSPTATYQWFNGNRTFDNNVFYGFHPASEPADANKITLNPQLVAPGTGGIGLDTVDGYKLQVGSPCIDAGIDIPNNGGLDYWGNVVPQNAAADIGAHESEWGIVDLDGDGICDYNDLKIIFDNWLDNFGAADIAPDGAPDGIINFLDYAALTAVWDWPDYNAPTPNPMGWQSDPNATSSTEITMTAQTASDKSSVQYYFANVTDPNHDSGWQPGTNYDDTGLDPNTEYTYQVKARDTSPYYNETAYSVTTSATTAAAGSDPVVIFADGFEACFANWTSNAYCSTSSYEGGQSCKMNNTDYAETNVSTSGYDSIRVRYARKLNTMVAGQQFVSEWYDGSSWHTIEDITNPAEFTDWTLVEFDLPGTADNNPDFEIRFEVDNSSSNYGYVDAVEILNMP